MGGPGSLSLKPVGSLPNEPIPEAHSEPLPNGPQPLSDVSVGKVAPGGGKIVEGEVPDYKVALKDPPIPEEPQPPKISAHDRFVRDLYAEVAKLSSRRDVVDLDVLVKKAAAVDEGAKTEITALVKAVRDSVAALNRLTGRQIADFANVSDQTAYKALIDVLNAHEDLALALTRLGAGKPLAVSRPLQVGANRLNQRICAITRLVGELNAQLLRADSEGLDLRNQFDRVSQVSGRRSGADEKWAVKLKRLTEPLERELEGFGSSDRPITDEMVRSAQGKLQKIKKDADFLALCATGTRKLSGKDTARLAALGWTPQEIVRIRESVFADIRQVLDRASKQLGQAHLEKASKEAVQRMVGALRMPGENALIKMSEQLKNDGLRRLVDADRLETMIAKFVECQATCDVLRKEMQKELAGRNPVAARETVRQILDDLAFDLRLLGVMVESQQETLADQLKRATGNAGKVETDLLKALLAGLKSLDGALSAGGGVARALEDQIARIRDLSEPKPAGESWYDPQVMTRILDEPDVFMTAVEAHVHGIDLSLVDLDCSTKNLVAKEPLGTGAFSTAYLCTFKRPDGSTVQRVFKPDLAATAGLFRGIHKTFGGGKRNGLQRAVHYNVALHDVATLLGAGSTVCRSSAAYVDGEFGFLMEVAPGVGSASVMKGTTFGKGPDGEGISLEDFREADSGTKTAVFAQMAEQLSRLQWTDLIGGQLDRHGGNYAVHVTKGGTVSIKGYDNDQSLAAEMVGIGKVRVPSWEHLVQKICKGNKDLDKPGFVADQVRRLKNWFKEPGTGRELYHMDSSGRVTFDMRELKTGPQLSLLIKGTGLHSIAVPSYMDRSTYERIKDLTKADGSGLKLFRDTLRKRGMTRQQIDAAVTRLLEASRIADDLMAAHRVYTREQLANETVLRQILDNDGHLNEMLNNTPDDFRKDVEKGLFSVGTNYLHRSPFSDLINAYIPPKVDNNLEADPDGRN